MKTIPEFHVIRIDTPAFIALQKERVKYTQMGKRPNIGEIASELIVKAANV